MENTQVAALYRAYSTQNLLQLRWAFNADRSSADAEGRAFIDGRLALIAAELRLRGLADSSTSDTPQGTA